MDEDLREVPERRTATVVACALAAGAVVLGVAAVAGLRSAAPDLDEREPFAAVRLDPELAAVLGTATAHVVEREGGWFDLRALGLAADGTLSGGEQHLDRGWFDTWGRAVQVDLATGATAATEVAPDVVAARDAAAVLTLEHLDPRHDDDLVCTPLVGGRRTVLTAGSVVPGSVVLTAGRVVWSVRAPGGDDGAPTVHVAERSSSGCPDGDRVLPLRGTVVAADGDDVYVLRPGEDWPVRADATTGRLRALPRPAADALPAALGHHDRDDDGHDGGDDGGDDGVDAGGGRLAWWSGDALLVMDVATGEVVVAAEGLVPVVGHGGSGVRVRAGERLVTWSTWPVDGDPGLSRGVVHDPASGRTAELGGEALASAGWVVWLADDGYRFVRTS